MSRTNQSNQYLSQSQPQYNGRTGGLEDLVGRRVLWGSKKARVVDYTLDENGAYAYIRIVGKEKIYHIAVEHLRLVPPENMPNADCQTPRRD